ncbi:hypothetical protein H6F51_16500 [Cyanobacteria bacterium FACHB-DQ100]|nr:hypothetical protein [Cyanobacteria bacterium FACHB-DQ100]
MLNVLPLRAILYQLFFIVLAIAVEAIVLQFYLGIGKKSSIQYASTANLFSTVVGWLVFFSSDRWLPQPWQQQLMNYIFLDEISNYSLLVVIAFVTFLGTFVVKLQSLNWLDLILENKPTSVMEVRDRTKFQGKSAQRQAFQEVPSRALAVLLANSASFALIALIILIRTVSEQPVAF